MTDIICPNCGEANLEQHKRLPELLVCPLCWRKYDKGKALKGEFILVKAKKKMRWKKDKKQYPKAYIIISAHKPSGVWPSRWFTVTWSVYEGKRQIIAGSTPFQSPKDISRYVDEATAYVKGRWGEIPIEKQWWKDDPSLTWHDDEEGTKDWKEMFN